MMAWPVETSGGGGLAERSIAFHLDKMGKGKGFFGNMPRVAPNRVGGQPSVALCRFVPSSRWAGRENRLIPRSASGPVFMCLSLASSFFPSREYNPRLYDFL